MDDLHEPDGPGEEIQQAMVDFENEARKLGCYMQGFAVAVTGDAEDTPVILVTLLVGEQAFSNRVMDPEKHEEDKQFRTITAEADMFQAIREEAERKMKEGEDPI